MAAKNSIPEIRFKGFKGEWTISKLSDLGDFKSNGVDKKINANEIPVNLLNYMDVYNSRVINSYNSNSLMQVTAKPNQLLENCVLENDVFFTPSSETPEDIGKVLVINETLPNTVYSYHLMRYRPKESIFYSIFPNYGFACNYVRKQLILAAQGVQRYVVSKPSFENITVFVPSLPEQTQIGTYFQNLDSLISLQQNKYNKLLTMKKAMLEKMFPKEGADVPEIRFKGFEGKWEKKKLGEIAKKVNEKNINSEISNTFTNSAEFGIVNQRDFFDKDISNSENIHTYYVVMNDDFVYNPRISNYAPVGPIGRNKLNEIGVISPLYTVFRTNDIDNTFLEYYFKSIYWHSFMKLNGDTGARADRFSIKNSIFFEMPIPFTVFEEQTKIGTFFQTLDTLISEQQKQLEKLKNIKKACLEKMFV